jgi:hypothetical protein
METQKKALSVDEAAVFIGLSKNYIYKLVHLKKSLITSSWAGACFSNRRNWKLFFSETDKKRIMKTQGGTMNKGSSKLPPEIITAFEAESAGLTFGTVKLEAHFHDGIPRFVIGRERSIIPGVPTSGVAKEAKNE